MTKLVKSPIDAYVGSRVKLRRKIVGMSQTELANQLGISYQQMQKYEKGANRIGASRLYEIASFLNVPVESLFEGIDDVVKDAPDAYEGAVGDDIAEYEEFIRNPAGIDFCKAFVGINDPATRKRFTALIKSISATQ